MDLRNARAYAPAMSKLRELIKRANATAEFLFYKHGRLEPIWHPVTKNGDEFITPQPHKDKDFAALLIRIMFNAEGVVRYVYIDEAWQLSSEDGVPQEDLETLDYATHPKRREVIQFVAEDATEGVLLGLRRIERRDGKATLGPLHFEKFGEVGGRFVGLLPQPHKRTQ